MKPANKFGFNWLFIVRSYHLCGIIFPSWFALSTLLFYLLILVAVIEQVLIYNVGLISSKYYIVLGSRDLNGFWSATETSILYIIALVLVMSSRSYICNVTYVCWRQLLCSSIHQYYFFHNNYYHLNVIGSTIDNPDQRVTQDVDKMCNVWSQIIAVIVVAPFRIGYYTYATYVVSGYIGPVGVLAFFIIGTVINKLLMTPVVRFVVKQEKFEGDFRFNHMRVRSNAESLAFLNGGAAEADDTSRKLNKLMHTQIKLFNRQYPLTIGINLFDYIGSILSYLIIAVPIFSGVYNNYDAVQLSSLISQSSFVCMYLVNSFSQLVDQADKVTSIAGCTHRVGQLMEELKRLKERFNRKETEVKTVRNQTSGGSSDVYCRIVNVTFGPPNSQTILVNDLNLEIRKNVNLLITGDSGSGKSSMLRILCHLWPIKGGEVYRYYNFTPKEVFYLPQVPYFIGGSLYRQVIFPLEEPVKEVRVTENELITEYLRMVKLESVLNRCGGLYEDPEWNWNDALSPGELQRLSFVRLFYHQPRLAFLDEATSALNFELEEVMYEQCRNMGITLVSVGHRTSLRKFHQTNLHLNGSHGRWQLSEINKDMLVSL
ncbi:ATP-binding cassette sub- D member 4 [Chamberlinius hualienensis]